MKLCQSWCRGGSWFATLLLVAGISFTAGSLLHPPLEAGAEVRSSPVPEAFKSGGERSEIVLKQVLATLNKMDGRLQKIESVVVEFKSK